MKRNCTQISTFLDHKFVRNYSQSDHFRYSRFVVNGGTGAPRRAKGIDTPPPTGKAQTYLFKFHGLTPAVKLRLQELKPGLTH